MHFQNVSAVWHRIGDCRTAKPRANEFGEWLIGSVRRECLDHVVVFNERHLKRVLTRYFDYYHQWRTHLSLAMDSPVPRNVLPLELGKVIQVLEVIGLHHRYERVALQHNLGLREPQIIF